MTAIENILREFPEVATHADERRGLVELASAIVQLRARSGLTQNELAKASGVPETLISELENARNEGVAWRTIARLLKGTKARLCMHFELDEERAGEVDVRLSDAYAESARYEHVKELIDERNAQISEVTPVMLAA